MKIALNGTTFGPSIIQLFNLQKVKCDQFFTWFLLNEPSFQQPSSWIGLQFQASQSIYPPVESLFPNNQQIIDIWNIMMAAKLKYQSAGGYYNPIVDTYRSRY